MKAVRLIITLAGTAGLLTACGHRQPPTLREELTGTWRVEPKGAMTLAADGSFHSRWTTVLTNAAPVWTYDGTWDVQDEYLVETITNASALNSTNHEAVGHVDRFRIVRVDDYNLVTEIGSDTNFFQRQP